MMPERSSIEMAQAPRLGGAIALAAGFAGLLLAAAAVLWVHYGTAVFFEMIRTGFVACFG